MSEIKEIHSLLIEKKKTLCLAESCTGGHLGAAFTSIPDASKYFLGSLVTYSNALKEEVLHVAKKTLQDNGAVSRSVAHEMWIGLMKLSDADYGIAVTGTAGPSGGTKEKPVGTVYIAIGEKGKKPHVFENHFKGDRMQVVEATIDKALSEFSTFLEDAFRV